MHVPYYTRIVPVVVATCQLKISEFLVSTAPRRGLPLAAALFVSGLAGEGVPSDDLHAA